MPDSLLMEIIRNLLQNILGFSPETQDKLFTTLLIVIGLWLLRALINRFLNRRFHDETRILYNSRKAVEYVMAVLGVFFIGRLWLEGIPLSPRPFIPIHQLMTMIKIC